MVATTARDVQGVMREPTGAVPGDPIAEMMREDASRLREVVAQPAKLTTPTPGSYRFRTRPGYRNTQIILRVFLPKDDTDENVKWQKRWERNAKRVWGPDWKQVLKVDRELWEDKGIDKIEFRPIPGVQECTYVTRDKKIAAYIRQRISEPDHGHIYEEVAPMAVEIDGTTVYVVPADDQARQAMAAAAAKGE